jgi:ATP synthase protein I
MPFHNPIPDRKQEKEGSGGIQTLVQAEKLTQIAVLLPSAAFIGWLAGAWLDSKLHQGWIGLAGVMLGGIAGLVYVVRLVISTGGGDSPKPGTKAGGNGSADGNP